MWPDNEIAKDFLNFSGVADMIAEIIVQARGRPISIGVSGAWRIGKSSMIKLTQTSLAQRPRGEGEREFISGGALPVAPPEPVRPDAVFVVLLSDWLDSLVGTIDLVASGKRPLAVSQTVRGGAAKQAAFAAKIGDGLDHLQLNHNARVPGDEEDSQRACSLTFITLGVLAATAGRRYHEGEVIPLYVCEKGFIAVNPPLTGGRIGSLALLELP